MPNPSFSNHTTLSDGVLAEFRKLPQNGKIMAEYIWIGGSGQDLRCKTRTFDEKPKTAADLWVSTRSSQHFHTKAIARVSENIRIDWVSIFMKERFLFLRTEGYSSLFSCCTRITLIARCFVLFFSPPFVFLGIFWYFLFVWKTNVSFCVLCSFSFHHVLFSCSNSRFHVSFWFVFHVLLCHNWSIKGTNCICEGVWRTKWSLSWARFFMQQYRSYEHVTLWTEM